MFLKAFIWVFILLFNNSVLSQLYPFKAYVDTLTSDYFSGRGYVRDGHLKTAKFIENEFANIGLEPIVNNAYLQKFPIKVNVFEEDLFVKKNGKLLDEGVDYIIDPSSASLTGTFTTKLINSTNFNKIINSENNNDLNQIFVVDASKTFDKDSTAYLNEMKLRLSSIGPVAYIQNSKLTWSVSSVQNKFPILYFNKLFSIIDSSIFELSIRSRLETIITNNICAKTSGRKRKFIVITAHYDHLGMLGRAIFPGANDNASGVSLLLNLAKYYSSKKNKYNMIFICFGAEEIGLLGSNYFVSNPIIDLDKIKFLINLDIVGTGDDGIAIVNAVDQKKYARKIGVVNKELKLFPKIKIRAQAPNSDHFWFSQKNVPAIFIYTLGGIKAYHDIYDKPDTLPLNKIYDLFLLINTFLKQI